jgi:hypothetical protein
VLARLNWAIVGVEGDADEEEDWLGRREAEELGFLGRGMRALTSAVNRAGPWPMSAGRE